MKISIGMKIQPGPYGGGNQFGASLSNYLSKIGHEVVYDLNSNDIDIILLTEPRKWLSISKYDHRDILQYVRKNPNTIVVHRINECDERKGTSDVNKFLIKANKVADCTVFISNWLQKLFLGHGIGCEHYQIICNGGNHTIFNQTNKKKWDGKYPIKLVTHHWSGNWLKGFDIYKKIDELLENQSWREKITFTYIGNMPSNFNFHHAKYIPPLSGIELAEELKKHDLYITGSINEPAGMHHIEAALCGLPLLFRDSGALPEYCSDYGLPFTYANFVSKLEDVIKMYDIFFSNLQKYPYNSDKMNREYLTLFSDLVKNRDMLIKQRNWNNNYIKYLVLKVEYMEKFFLTH